MYIVNFFEHLSMLMCLNYFVLVVATSSRHRKYSKYHFFFGHFTRNEYFSIKHYICQPCNVKKLNSTLVRYLKYLRYVFFLNCLYEISKTDKDTKLLLMKSINA